MRTLILTAAILLCATFSAEASLFDTDRERAQRNRNTNITVSSTPTLYEAISSSNTQGNASQSRTTLNGETVGGSYEADTSENDTRLETP